MAPKRSRAASEAPAPISRRASGSHPASAAANSAMFNWSASAVAAIRSNWRVRSRHAGDWTDTCWANAGATVSRQAAAVKRDRTWRPMKRMEILSQIAPAHFFIGEPHMQLFDLAAEWQVGRGFRPRDRERDREAILVAAGVERPAQRRDAVRIGVRRYATPQLGAYRPT